MSDLIDTDDDQKSSDEDVLDEARKNYEACQDADSDNRIEAVADLQFLVGGENQWDAQAVAARKADRRPIITVNTFPAYLHQITNEQRKNTPAIKVHPVGSGADLEAAKIRQGMIRHIEYDSNADVAYDTGVNSAAAIGFGYFGLVTDYESERSFKNQKIMFRRIRNALSVRIDPLAIEPDGSDMKFAFIELKMAKGAFKRKWPDANACTTSIFNDDTTYANWLTDTEVLVCDYYKIETTKDEVVLLSNGESGFKSDLIEMPEGVAIVDRRPGEKSKVMLYKITGVDILERTEIKSKWIPVFPVYGDEIDIEGKLIRSGIIRHAKGPKQMENVMVTSATEEISLRSKSPYIMAEGQEEGHEDEWTQANQRAFPYLTYKPTALDGHLVPPPQRNPMADIPTGWLALAALAADNVKKTAGILFDASRRGKGTATSGVQERAQQAEGEVGNYHYIDGLLRAVRHAGRVINYMIPHYYDTERVVKIMHEDGTVGHATINQKTSIDEVLNDMTGGEFDVTVTAGPSYSTLRQEAADGMTDIMAKSPQLWPIMGDLFVRSQDWPDAGLIADRIEKTIDPKLIEPKDGSKPPPIVMTPHGPLEVSKVPQILAQMEGQITQMGEALKKADADKQQAELIRQQTDHMKQQQIMNEQQLEPQRIEAEKMKLAADLQNAETARITAQADMLRAQAESEAIPHNAHAQAVKAETDYMAAHTSLLTAQQQAHVAAAEAEAAALDGNETALEVWKATVEAETKIRVAQIMAGSHERIAALKPKGKDNGQTA